MSKRRYRAGIVGCGGMGKAHLDVLATHAGFELVAACDVNPQALAAVPSGVKTYSDAAALFAENRLDVVSLILPNYLYLPTVKLAAAHGAHVLCEKPLGKDLADCRAISAELRGAGLKGWVSAQRKYFNHFLQARAHVERLQPRQIAAAFTYWWGAAFGEIRWRGNRAQSGGVAVIDSGWHALDLLDWFVGGPTAAQASLGYLAAYPEIDDRATIRLDYPEQLQANLFVSYTWPQSRFDFTFVNGRHAVGLDLQKCQLFTDGQVTEEIKAKPEDQVFTVMYDQLHLALGGKTAYLTDLDRAERIMGVVNACYRSDRSGGPIQLGG